jgi:DNA repair exonuclease SbcCD nuclease subunit
MRKLVAIATADWHLYKFKNFDVNGSRLKYSLEAGSHIFRTAERMSVPVLFAGDLHHNPKEVENETNTAIQTLFNSLRTNFYYIDGNHDMSEKNSLSHRSPSHINSILNDRLTNVNHTHISTKDMFIQGVSYMNNDSDLKKAIRALEIPQQEEGKLKILLLHSDAPGAKTPEGFEIGEVEAIPNNLDKFFKKWDLVLFGHIHQAQRLSKKCYMLGCPIPQDAGNVNGACGYWKVYSDGKMQFVAMENAPQFIKLKEGEKPKDDGNYYIPFDDVLAEEELNTGVFNVNYSKAKLAKRYLALNKIKSKSKKRALIEILNQNE